MSAVALAELPTRFPVRVKRYGETSPEAWRTRSRACLHFRWPVWLGVEEFTRTLNIVWKSLK
jgi:hypothetical protein